MRHFYITSPQIEPYEAFRQWAEHLQSESIDDVLRKTGLAGHISTEEYYRLAINTALPDQHTGEALAALMEHQGLVEASTFLDALERRHRDLRQSATPEKDERYDSLRKYYPDHGSSAYKAEAPKIISLPEEAVAHIHEIIATTPSMDITPKSIDDPAPDVIRASGALKQSGKTTDQSKHL